MKKNLALVLVLALVMAVAVVAFAACAEPQTVEGEYKHVNAWDESKFYGVKVSVTVKGNVITEVKVTSTDTEDYTNLSASWPNKAVWTDGQAAFLKSFEGLTVEEVNAITVAKTDKGQPDTGSSNAVKNPFTNLPEGLKVVQTAEGTGATQSTGRVILAVQNALSKLAK